MKKINFEEMTVPQKRVIVELNDAMQNLFNTFVKVDEQNIPISDALDIIGIEIPLLLKPAMNQLSGKLKQMRKGALEEKVT